MKTTIEVADGLMTDARRFAAERGLTLREVFEAGLRSALNAAPRGEARRFRLKRRAFKGKGIAQERDWAEIRGMIYKGRGE